jgi:hypothetical protein
MANTIGKFIKAWKNVFDNLDSKINFSIPENLVSYMWINGRQNDKNLELTENNFRLQIGKMQKDKETIYTKEILLPAIEYIIKKTWAGEKAIIQLRPDLAKSLINQDKREESKKILSFEEEKQKIIQLIKKYFKNETQKIEIINVSNQYPELFSLLKRYGKNWLSSTQKPILNKNTISALDIAKYLYRSTQHNQKLMELFYNTKTPIQKENDINSIWGNQSDYYSLVEVSIRLYEILCWISIQWWIDRQSKYDKIIWWIIQWKDIDTFKTTNYPELEELNKFCKQINPNLIFDRLYISTKEVREVEDKKQSLSKLKSRSLVTSVALLSVLAWLFWWYQLSQHKQKKEKDGFEKKLSKRELNDSQISFYWTNTVYEYGKDLEKKREYLDDVANSMFYFMQEVYWPFDKSLEDKIKSILKDELLRVKYTYQKEDWEHQNIKNIETFFQTTVDWSLMYRDDFVIKNIVPNNKMIFNSLWCNPIPYNKFLKYRSDFQETLSIKWDLHLHSSLISWDFVDINTTDMKFKRKSIGGGYVTLEGEYDMEYIGTYYDYRAYDYYHFVRMKSENGKTIILASWDSSYRLDYSMSNEFSLQHAKEWIQKVMWYREKYWAD